MDLTTKDISISTISRVLKRNGYKYVQAKKKGVLSEKDTKKRLAFARNMKEKYSDDVWTRGIAFYIDAVSFYHKRNPMDHAWVPLGRVWRTTSEALDLDCTARGSHVGLGAKVLNLMVAISYDTGVILCEPYKHMNGDFYSKFIREHFRQIFQKSGKRSKRFVQDRDPSQNSAKAKKALKRVRAALFSIPPRSPDINPIESLFAYVK